MSWQLCCKLLSTGLLFLIHNHVVVAHSGDDWISDDVFQREPLVACEVSSESGLYGEKSNTTKSVKYEYQMEYNQNSESEVDQLVREVEESLSNALLPSVFEENCATIVARRRMMMLRRSWGENMGRRALDDSQSTTTTKLEPLQLSQIGVGRHLYFTGAAGLSSQPADIITSRECSDDMISSTNSICIIVEGELTLFYSEGGDDSDLSDNDAIEIKSLIKALMDDGHIVDAMDDESGVYTLAYIDESDESIDLIEVVDRPKSNNGGKVSLITIGSISAIGLIAFGTFKLLKKRGNS